MPAGNQIKKSMADAYFSGITLKIGLVKNTYVHNPDNDFIDSGTSDDIQSHECDATNYAAKTVALGSNPFVVNDASDISTLDIADQTWSTLGGATNNTVNGLYVANNAGGADTAREVIGVIPFSAHTTDGNDFTLNISELIRLANG